MGTIWDFTISRGFFHGSSEEFWRENLHGGWATVLALLFIFLWHFSKRFFCVSHVSSVSSSSSSLPVPPSNSTASSSRTSQFRISEIVTDADLKFLMENLDEKIYENEKWDSVIDKRNNLLSYSAKSCKPKDAPLKYSSVTIFENCSTETLRDFYMDIDYRKQWDRTTVDHWQLQVDESSGVEVGRTIKKFPLLTPREYVLAWRLWEGKDDTFYCFIKECEHPSAPRQKKYVRVRLFRSGWRIRKVPGRNACEIKMYHQEDAALNVEMAKLAFAKGIWSYVCKMDNALRKYPDAKHPPTNSAVNAVPLIKMVPPGLDDTIGTPSQSTSSDTAFHELDSGQDRNPSRRPSKKMVANSLLLLGGLICLSRGHSSLGAKVAMAYILNKLRKREASSSQSQ
ncbi:hypothetical protein UlMin_041675 [Ulmus minor]